MSTVQPPTVSIFQREPAVLINAIIAVVEAGITMLVAFGLQLEPAQQGAIMTFVITVGALLSTVLIRSRVTPLTDPRNNDGVPLTPQR